MKTFCLILACAITASAFSQDTPQASVLQISEKVFKWGMAGQMDSLATILDPRMFAVFSDGNIRTRAQCLRRPDGMNPAHYNIQLESSRATVAENTAVVTGKAMFLAKSGKIKSAVHFSYMEVFTRPNEQSPWKLLAINANGF